MRLCLVLRQYGIFSISSWNILLWGSKTATTSATFFFKTSQSGYECLARAIFQDITEEALVQGRPAQHTARRPHAARECVLCGLRKHFKVSQQLNSVFSVFYLLCVIERISIKSYSSVIA